MHRLDVSAKSSPFCVGEWLYFLYLSVLCLMFLFRDVYLVSIPLLVFIVYFALGYMVFDYDHFLALTAMMPLLGHGIQTNYLILIAIIVYVLKNMSGIIIKKPLVIVAFLMVYELVHVLSANDSISEYLRYVIQYVYVGLILGESQIKKLLKKPIIILKTFIFMAFYFMIDVLLVTLQYVPFDEFFSTDFRFGSITDFVGDKPSLGDNQNMVALFAIVTISLILVCAIFERKNYLFYSFATLYFVFFGLLTASKTFIICLLILTIFVLFLLLKKSFLKTILIVLGLVLVVYILSQTVFADAFSHVMERFKAEDISTGRNSLFKLYNEFIFSKPKYLLFGIGLQNVEIKTFMSNTPHNAIQEIVLCWGIPGLFAIGLLCCQLFRKYRQISKKEKFAYIIPFIVFMTFIQTIQFVRLSSIFGLLVLLYIVVIIGGVNDEPEKDFPDND